MVEEQSSDFRVIDPHPETGKPKCGPKIAGKGLLECPSSQYQKSGRQVQRPMKSASLQITSKISPITSPRIHNPAPNWLRLAAGQTALGSRCPPGLHGPNKVNLPTLPSPAGVSSIQVKPQRAIRPRFVLESLRQRRVGNEDSVWLGEVDSQDTLRRNEVYGGAGGMRTFRVWRSGRAEPCHLALSANCRRVRQS